MRFLLLALLCLSPGAFAEHDAEADAPAPLARRDSGYRAWRCFLFYDCGAKSPLFSAELLWCARSNPRAAVSMKPFGRCTGEEHRVAVESCRIVEDPTCDKAGPLGVNADSGPKD